MDLHLQEKVTKASQMVGWMLRTFRARDENTVMTLYKTLVLPHLEYCSIIWAPTATKDLVKLEQVQRRATRAISGLQKQNYWERLKKLHLFSVQRRFERYLIIYCFKCIHDIVPNPGIKFTINPRTGISCYIPLKNATDKKIVKNLKNHSFLYRAPTLYNKLPLSLKQIFNVRNPLESFKSELDKYLFRIPDQPSVNGLTRAANSNSICDQVLYISSE